MKPNILMLLICSVLLLNSCADDNNSIENFTFPGEYTGTFERNGIESSITLNLEEATFNGTSDSDNFPAICNGSYLTDSSMSTITFENTCFFTADFDWTLILKETWNYEIVDETNLVLTKQNGDVYRLSKQ